MAMEGYTCRIFIHPPNESNIHELQCILISDEFEWDPSNNLFETYSLEKEYRKSSNSHCHANLAKIDIPCAPPNIQCRYN